MNISRKEFFTKGLFSIGEALHTVSAAFDAATAAESPDLKEKGFVPLEGDDLLAVALNEHCLAKNCGCFACVERCEPQAIMMVMGEGIRIDASLCTGCGACEYVCPVTPRGIRLQPRGNEADLPA